MSETEVAMTILDNIGKRCHKKVITYENGIITTRRITYWVIEHCSPITISNDRFYFGSFGLEEGYSGIDLFDEMVRRYPETKRLLLKPIR